MLPNNYLHITLRFFFHQKLSNERRKKHIDANYFRFHFLQVKNIILLIETNKSIDHYSANQTNGNERMKSNQVQQNQRYVTIKLMNKVPAKIRMKMHHSPKMNRSYQDPSHQMNNNNNQ